MDLEMLKTAIGQERSEYEETQRELAEMGLLPDSPNGSGISREITMFQLETLTKTYELLRKISLDLPESVIEQNADRVKVAEKNAAEILKTLNMGERK
nr:hypothetical protein [Leptospirillum ferrooxidans]